MSLLSFEKDKKVDRNWDEGLFFCSTLNHKFLQLEKTLLWFFNQVVCQTMDFLVKYQQPKESKM